MRPVSWRQPSCSGGASGAHRPALEDFVRILETCLSGLENGTVTCFLDDLHGKTISLEPGIHKRDLCLNRVTVRDPQRLEDCKIFLIIT